jgi:hypothetical protein
MIMIKIRTKSGSGIRTKTKTRTMTRTWNRGPESSEVVERNRSEYMGGELVPFVLDNQDLGLIAARELLL